MPPARRAGAVTVCLRADPVLSFSGVMLGRLLEQVQVLVELHRVYWPRASGWLHHPAPHRFAAVAQQWFQITSTPSSASGNAGPPIAPRRRCRHSPVGAADVR